LRREELAQLAGVSMDYYTRLEQGRQPTASVSVLDALASALQLTDTERVYLHRLARVPAAPRTAGRAVPSAVRPGTYRLMELLETAPAILCDRRTDILAVNDAARLVFTDFTALPSRQRNAVRWFLTETAQQLYRDEWESIAGEMVGMLRLGASGRINDPSTVELVDELTANSPVFRRLWADRRVSAWLRESKTLHHPTAGTLQLIVEVLAVPGAPEQTLHIMMPKQGSRSESAIRELVSQSPRGK
jgi:transcriptional regulator with XRE-family HTH domain